MKIVILNGSPRKGNTVTAIQMFTECAQKRHEVEIVDTYKLNVSACMGCGVCECHKGCVANDDSNFIVKGNNFKSSFIMYKEMNDLSKVTFTNMLGQIFTYKIDSVKRVKNVKNINYDGDLILIVKNYYNFEYIIYICNGI